MLSFLNGSKGMTSGMLFPNSVNLPSSQCSEVPELQCTYISSPRYPFRIFDITTFDAIFTSIAFAEYVKPYSYPQMKLKWGKVMQYIYAHNADRRDRQIYALMRVVHTCGIRDRPRKSVTVKSYTRVVTKNRSLC